MEIYTATAHQAGAPGMPRGVSGAGVGLNAGDVAGLRALCGPLRMLRSRCALPCTKPAARHGAHACGIRAFTQALSLGTWRRS